MDEFPKTVSILWQKGVEAAMRKHQLRQFGLLTTSGGGNPFRFQVLPKVFDPQLHEMFFGDIVLGENAAPLAQRGWTQKIPS